MRRAPTLDIAAGVAVLEGDDAAGQGRYLVREDAATLSAVTIGTAHATLPRIDLVGIQLQDPSEGGAAGRNCVFAVEAGTADAAPSAPATPDSFLVLASVLVPAGAVAIDDGDITDLRDHAILAHTDLIDDAVIASAKIADGAVTTAKLANGAVTAAKIASETITANQLASPSVNTAKLADGNVTTAKIADGAVTNAKIATAPGGTVGNIKYRKLGDMVFLWGSTSGGEKIPAGYRPGAPGVTIAAIVAPSTAGFVSVATNGAVNVSSGSTHNFSGVYAAA